MLTCGVRLIQHECMVVYIYALHIDYCYLWYFALVMMFPVSKIIDKMLFYPSTGGSTDTFLSVSSQ